MRGDSIATEKSRNLKRVVKAVFLAILIVFLALVISNIFLFINDDIFSAIRMFLTLHPYEVSMFPEPLMKIFYDDYIYNSLIMLYLPFVLTYLGYLIPTGIFNASFSDKLKLSLAFAFAGYALIAMQLIAFTINIILTLGNGFGSEQFFLKEETLTAIGAVIGLVSEGSKSALYFSTLQNAEVAAIGIWFVHYSKVLKSRPAWAYGKKSVYSGLDAAHMQSPLIAKASVKKNVFKTMLFALIFVLIAAFIYFVMYCGYYTFMYRAFLKLWTIYRFENSPKVFAFFPVFLRYAPFAFITLAYIIALKVLKLFVEDKRILASGYTAAGYAIIALSAISSVIITFKFNSNENLIYYLLYCFEGVAFGILLIYKSKKLNKVRIIAAVSAQVQSQAQAQQATNSAPSMLGSQSSAEAPAFGAAPAFAETSQAPGGEADGEIVINSEN